MNTPVPDWLTLRAELDRWQHSARTATLWWRDDDAVAVTPELERLCELAGEHQAEIALAVIPAAADEGLDSWLQERVTPFWVVQHGYLHHNHAPAGEKSSELGDHRPAAVVLDELRAGWQLLRGWRSRTLPVLVPPWNRIGAEVEAGLRGQCWSSLSTFGPRRSPLPGEELHHCNTHVDPIDWPRKPAFAGEAVVLAQLIEHLAARREGRVDAAEPTGLMTHHRVQDEAVWRFCRTLLEHTCGHRAVRWLSPQEACDGPTLRVGTEPQE